MFTCVILNIYSKFNHLLEHNNSSIILSLKITILICPSWVKQDFKRYSNYYCLWIFILLSIYGILLHFLYWVWFTIRIVLLFSLLLAFMDKLTYRLFSWGQGKLRWWWRRLMPCIQVPVYTVNGFLSPLKLWFLLIV